MSEVSSPRKLWLFSKWIDLTVFLGSAVLATLALVVGSHLGLLAGEDTDAPQWTWVTAILLIDVAHVWATGFRVYFIPSELRRRPLLYGSVPVLSFVVGVALYSEGSLVFWRVLAYLAVFHFVRQQYGWVALYRARRGERDRIGKWIDGCAIDRSMLYPLVWWHSHLPRRYNWFLPGDFVGLPEIVSQILAPMFWISLALYVARSISCWSQGRGNPGKDIVVLTTAWCWYVGIVVFDSDYAFTVTNVIIHGVPYFALIWWYRAREQGANSPAGRFRWLFLMLSVVWILAFIEEMLWDRGFTQKRSLLFGEGWNLEEIQFLLVPLLAVPQLTHYILDGFIWRRKSNPGLAALFE